MLMTSSCLAIFKITHKKGFLGGTARLNLLTLSKSGASIKNTDEGNYTTSLIPPPPKQFVKKTMGFGVTIYFLIEY